VKLHSFEEGTIALKLHGVHHEVGVHRVEENLGEGWSLGEEHPNIIQDSNMIQDEGVQAQ